MSRLNEILANALFIELALRKLNPSELLSLYHSLISNSQPSEAIQPLLAEAKASADKELSSFISSLKDEIKDDIIASLGDDLKDDIQSDIIFEIRERLS